MSTELVTNNLNSQVYEILKNKILSKELKPGTRLVDSQIAHEFGISRTPIRDAIRNLAEDGLVVAVGKKGYAVFQPSVTDINEIFELRSILDIAAVTKLITEILPDNKEVMTRLEQDYLEYGKNNNGQDFIRSDEDFHDMLIHACGNSRLTNIYTELRTQTRFFRSKTSVDKARKEKAILNHQQILNGLKALDLEAAISAVKQHVETSRRDAINDYLKNSNG